MKGDLIRKHSIQKIYEYISGNIDADSIDFNGNAYPILALCNFFLSHPNQCALTDRCAEDIIELCNDIDDVVIRECITKLNRVIC